MSHSFLTKFVNRQKCFSCKKSSFQHDNRVYSLCSGHLLKARLQWRSHASLRKARGQCCYCAKAAVNGELRCPLHKEINRVRSLTWSRAHPQRAHLQWEMKKTYRDNGMCPTCPQHRMLKDGYMRCEPCRMRSRLRKKTA